MAELKATDVQYILNTIPISKYQIAYGLDMTLINLLGGFSIGTGRIQVPFRYAGNPTAGSFGESDDLSTAGHQSRRMLSQDYKRVYVTFGIDGMQEAIAKAGGLILDNNDLLTDEALGGIEDLLDEVNTQLIGDGTGNSNKDLDGVRHHIADDNTWMGLARSGNTWIQSYVLDHGGELQDLTKELIQAVADEIVYNRKSNYDAIFTTVALKNAYEELMTDAKRYVDVVVGDIKMKKLSYDDRPIFAIPGYAAHTWDFVRRMDFSVPYLPQVARDSHGREFTGIFKVEPVAKVSDDTTMRIIAYLNLVCKNPWKQGSLQDVQ